MEDKAQFLGQVFDSKLTWKVHVDYVEDICKKRLNHTRAIDGNKWVQVKKVLRTVYRSLVHF